MDDGTDSRAILQARPFENAAKAPSPFAASPAAIAEKRPSEGAVTAEKRITDRVATNDDAVCSPEGIRTPDLFLESDKVERSGLANYSRTN